MLLESSLKENIETIQSVSNPFFLALYKHPNWDRIFDTLQ